MLLENGRDSETSAMRESSADVDVDDVDLPGRPRDFLFLASRGMVSKTFRRTKKPHNTNAADEIFYVKEITAV